MDKNLGSNSYLEDDSYYGSMTECTNNENNTNSSELDHEEQEKLKEEWRLELQKTEEEIQTLRQVLSAKVCYSQELKRKLGISALSEIKSDLNKGITTIKASDKFQKTTAVVKAAKEKTSTALSEKWGILRNTNTFRNLENKMGSAYTSVKGRLTNSKSEHVNLQDPSAVGDVDKSDVVSESEKNEEKN